MNKSFNSLHVLVLSVFIAGLTLAGCKENTLINSKISPAGNAIGVYDTSLACITHTYFDDTVITSTNIGGIPIYQAVGTITDPYFGTMTGTTFFQIMPQVLSSAVYAADSVIDSAILVLPYAGFTYGDTANENLTQTYQVFYVTDTMGSAATAVYHAYDTKPIDAVFPLSEPTTVNLYHLKDSMQVSGKNHAGLRIKLKLPLLLSKLLPVLNGLSTATSTQEFLNGFKGICVRVANTNDQNTAIPYFQLDGSDLYSQAGIVVYHHPIGKPTDTLVQGYSFNTGSCSHFNNITSSYGRFPLAKLLNSKAANDEIIALQNQPGANLDIVIPGIKSLPVGIINKAEIQFTMLPGAAYNPPLYAAPERLYPVGIGNGKYPAGVNAGIVYNVADRYPLYSLSPFNVLDGHLHTYTTAGTTLNSFTINIPREVMASIAAKNDTLHLHISGTQDYYGAFHMVAGGGNYPDPLYRAKLNVVYSKLDN